MTTRRPTETQGTSWADRPLSRRRFIGGSIVTIGALTTAGAIVGASTAAGPPAARATTLTDILRAAPATLPGGGSPRGLLDIARVRHTTPKQVAASLGLFVGDQASTFGPTLDAVWPYELMFSQQSLAVRRAALEWAVGNRARIPNLGPRRQAPAELASRPIDLGPHYNQPWKNTAVRALNYAAGVSSQIALPPEPVSERHKVIELTRPLSRPAITREP